MWPAMKAAAQLLQAATDFLGLFHHQNQYASICLLHQQRDLVELAKRFVDFVSKTYDRNKLRSPKSARFNLLVAPIV